MVTDASVRTLMQVLGGCIGPRRALARPLTHRSLRPSHLMNSVGDGSQQRVLSVEGATVSRAWDTDPHPHLDRPPVSRVERPPMPSREQPSLQNIRLSADVSNPLSRSRN
jgi:hypothetical protein